MLTVCLEGLWPAAPRLYFQPKASVSCDEFHNLIRDVVPIDLNDVYFTCNGKKISNDTLLFEGVVRAVLRINGGKGGFGSMLRAIGAQIEKTTNREACRDLSGRRLRDINEEKRLKNWIGKKAEREREAAERKQKKLEKLRSEPKHEFKDKQYEQERSKLTDDVYDSVEKGFQKAAGEMEPGPSKRPVKPKKGFMFEDEISDSSLSSSDESTEGETRNISGKRNVQSSSLNPDTPCKKARLSTEPQESDSSDSDSGECSTGPGVAREESGNSDSDENAREETCDNSSSSDNSRHSQDEDETQETEVPSSSK